MLSVGESAELLGVSGSRVRALIKAGRIPASKNGREWVLREEDVLQRLAERPGPGRPKAKAAASPMPYLPDEAPLLHRLYEECRQAFDHVPTAETMAQAESREEAGFYVAAADFFLQQRQAQLVKAGVF